MYVYVCVYVCMYVYMCVCMCVCVYICMYACMYVCMYLCMCEYTYVCIMYRPIVPFLLIMKIYYTNWESPVLDSCKSQSMLFATSLVPLTQAFPPFRLHSVECEHQHDPRIRKDKTQTHLDIFKVIFPAVVRNNQGNMKNVNENGRRPRNCRTRNRRV